MTREELQLRLESAERELKAINQLEAEIQNLKERLAAMQEDEIPESPKFKCEEDYYYMDDYLGVEDGFGSDDRCDFNRFHTEEYATLFATKCREVAMLMHCKWYIDRDYDPNWCDHAEEKYTVYFDYDDNRWDTSMDQSGEYGNVYFETNEKAKKAAEWMNKHFNKKGSVLL